MSVGGANIGSTDHIVTSRLEKAAGFAAALSYPLYIMHGPIIRGFETWIAPPPPVVIVLFA